MYAATKDPREIPDPPPVPLHSVCPESGFRGKDAQELQAWSDRRCRPHKTEGEASPFVISSWAARQLFSRV